MEMGRVFLGLGIKFWLNFGFDTLAENIGNTTYMYIEYFVEYTYRLW